MQTFIHKIQIHIHTYIHTCIQSYILYSLSLQNANIISADPRTFDSNFSIIINNFRHTFLPLVYIRTHGHRHTYIHTYRHTHSHMAFRHNQSVNIKPKYRKNLAKSIRKFYQRDTYTHTDRHIQHSHRHRHAHTHTVYKL